MKKIEIILVEDKEMHVRGIKRTFEKANENNDDYQFDIVAVYRTEKDCKMLVPELKNKKPDILILDMEIETESLLGFFFLKEINEQPELKTIKTIILSDTFGSDKELIEDCFKNGAKACCDKDNMAIEEEFVDIVKKIYNGYNTLMSQGVSDIFFRNEEDTSTLDLNETELFIFNKLILGLNLASINDEIDYIDIERVRQIRTEIKQKIFEFWAKETQNPYDQHMDNDISLLIYALQNNLISKDEIVDFWKDQDININPDIKS